MAFIQWTPELDVHVNAMNDDHKQIITLMNIIHDTNQTAKTKQEVVAAVDNLFNFTAEHFRKEEEYLEQIKYPGVKQHKEIHQKLLERFKYNFQEFSKHEEVKLSSRFFDFLKLWISSHIKGIDTHYGDFSQTHQKVS